MLCHILLTGHRPEIKAMQLMRMTCSAVNQSLQLPVNYVTHWHQLLFVQTLQCHGHQLSNNYWLIQLPPSSISSPHTPLPKLQQGCVSACIPSTLTPCWQSSPNQRRWVPSVHISLWFHVSKHILKSYGYIKSISGFLF